MRKTHNIIMLSTDKADYTSLIKNDDKNNSKGQFWKRMNKDSYFTQDYLKYIPAKSYHLYIISEDEKIETGDYVYDNYRKELLQAIDNANSTFFNMSLHRYIKIIASTDKLLKPIENKYSPIEYLSQIPESFVQAYIKSYNGGNTIIEIDLEYEEYGKELGADPAYFGLPSHRLKTREDNTIIIHQSKTYTKEQVISLIELAFACCSVHAIDKDYDVEKDCESWINTHLN